MVEKAGIRLNAGGDGWRESGCSMVGIVWYDGGLNALGLACVAGDIMGRIAVGSKLLRLKRRENE